MNPPDDWLKTGWARYSQKRTRLLDSLHCITCSFEDNAFSLLHYLIKVTPDRFEIHFCHGTFAHSFIRAICHLHDGVILLLWPGSFGVLLSCANLCFCYLNLTGATKFKYEKKTKIILVVVLNWRHRANGPLQIFPGKHALNPHTSFYSHPKGMNIALSTLLRVSTLLYQHC